MANIISNIFKLTKEIEAAPKRDLIKQLFSELHKSESTSSSIGYHGRHLYRQFLGYLAIYKDRDRINQESLIKIEELPPQTVELFTYGHSMIKGINQLCLNPLLDMIPNSVNTIDPYWSMENGRDFSIEIDLSSPLIDNLTQSFHLEKPFEIIKNRLKYTPQFKNLTEQEIANAVYSIIERIKQVGFQKCPDDIFEISMKVNQLNPESALSAIILSLISIHSSLQVIDQLLFQSFISNKITCLDENNIYNVVHMGSNTLSENFEVMTSEFVHVPGEIIIIDLPFNDFPTKKRFCMVEHIEMKFSQDFGHETIVGARCIDDNASYYPNLVKQIKLIE